MATTTSSSSSSSSSSSCSSSSSSGESVNENSVYIISPECSGHLIKRGFYWRKLWRRKWVILHGDEISYMAEKPTKETARDIEITKARITVNTVIDTEDLDDDPKGFALQINDDENGSDSSPTWYLRAETMEDKKLWLNNLCRVHAILFWLNQYEKVKILGIGGSAVVHELKHRRTGKRYAMKEMEIKNRGMMEMAIAEVEMLMNVLESVNHHPNIMEIHKVFQVGDKFYLVFPLCTGGELYNTIIKRGHFTELDAAVIFKELISALNVLHSHDILHLDIKPENILFESDDPDALIKLTDFGLAKAFHKEIETETCTADGNPTVDELNKKLQQFLTAGVLQNHMRGTMGYMSPELILCGVSSKPADIWASGVVLFILLSGTPPFHSRSNRDILEKSAKGEYTMEGEAWESVSDDAKDLINKMLTFDPSTRITAAEILEHPWVKMVAADDAVNELATSTSKSSRRLPSTTPLNSALKNLTGHVKDRRMEKMATNLSKLMTSLQLGKNNGNGKAAKTLLQRLTAGVPGAHVENVEEDESFEDSMHSMMSNDTKESIIKMFQNSGSGDDGKLSIEEFYSIFQGVANGGDGGSPLMMILMGRFLDGDRDGYITCEDLFLAEAKILQRSSEFLKTIFRAFAEAIWYPGQKMNHLQMARSLGVLGNSQDGAVKDSEGRSTSDNNSTADVVEPPKYITAKHVSAIFERLGFNPEVGAEIFHDLCAALAEQRLHGSRCRKMSGADDESNERDVADILAERKTSTDGAPTLISHFPIANAVVKTVASTYSAATQDRSIDDYTMTKMDVNDFVAACEIDDILIRALQLKPRRRMMQMVAKSQTEKDNLVVPAKKKKKVHMEGWLEKQGSKVKTWKKRWFVLSYQSSSKNYVLKYFTAENRAIEKGFFVIKPGSSVSALADSFRGERKKHQNYFELNAFGNNGKSLLLLSADTPNKKAEWVDAIQKCIDSL